MLPAHFEEPSGFQWGKFTNAKGAAIRYGALQPAGVPKGTMVKGTMVIVTGFRESIEKYFEVARDLADKGFSVWIMDWRGQGGSDRFLKDHPQKMFHEGYDEHIDTLHHFADKIIAKTAGPLILMAHSMGAHIALRCLKEHAGVFDSAILTAPMLDIAVGPLSKLVARQMARFAKACNYLEKYVLGGSDWNEAKDPFTGNAKTSDPERYGAMEEIYKNKPELKMGDATYGWAYHTFQSIDILNDGSYLKSINTPVLMEISGDEAIVDKSAAERASRLLSDCTQVDVPHAKHEIWMERDDLRNLWLAKVGDFLEERLNSHASLPKKSEKNRVPKLQKAG